MINIPTILLSVASLSCNNNSRDANAILGINSATTDVKTKEIQTASPENSSSQQNQKYTWNESEVINIKFTGRSAQSEGPGVKIKDNLTTINAEGVYRITGTLDDGQLLVDTQDKNDVILILSNTTLRSSSISPLLIENAEETVIFLEDNSNNSIVDGKTRPAGLEKTDAALFSKSDLTISGNGKLTVTGNYSDAIYSNDGIKIISGNIEITAADDGINGKDHVKIEDGQFVIKTVADAIKSGNNGRIEITRGNFDLNSGADAIQGGTEVTVESGDFNIVTGGGSASRISDTLSSRGIKASGTININGGNFSMNCAEDAINSGNLLTISGGDFKISSGDDAIHADTALVVSNADIIIQRSYEGLEAEKITINSGNIIVYSSDDGINIRVNYQGSTGYGRPGGFGGRGGRVPGGGYPGGTGSGDYMLTITGGSIMIDAGGDGIDANGSVTMTGGQLVVHGPVFNMNSAVDYDGSFTITGGVLVAAGSAGMAQAPGSYSSQNSLMVTFNSPLEAGTIVNIQSESGENIITFKPVKAYQTFVISSPALRSNGVYNVYTGGTARNEQNNGLYGSYTPGNHFTGVTLSGVTTYTGASVSGPGGFRRR